MKQLTKKLTSLWEDRPIVILVCLAFIVGASRFWAIYSVSGDALAYIETAKLIFSGDILQALRQDYHPLYPSLVAVMYNFTHNWTLAGRLVSFIFGSLIVIPVYMTTKQVFNKQAANISAIFFIFQPFFTDYLCDIVSEAVYVFFFVWSVLICWQALNQNKASVFFYAGLIVGLDYLARPEGLGTAVAVIAYVFVRNLSYFHKDWKMRLSSVCLLILGLLVFALPYLCYLKYETGQLCLSKKKSCLAAIGIVNNDVTIPETRVPLSAQIPAYSRHEGKYLNTLGCNIALFIKQYYIPLFLLGVFALVRGQFTNVQKNFQLFIALLLVFYLLIHSLFYAVSRHIIPLVVVSLFWSAVGFLEFGYILAEKLFKNVSDGRRMNSRRIFAAMLVIIIILMLPFTYRPVDKDKINQRQTGEWIKAKCKRNPVILTDMSRVVFYAEGQFVPLRNRYFDSYADLIKFVKNTCQASFTHQAVYVDYIVIDKCNILNYCPDFLRLADLRDLKTVYVKPKLPNSSAGDIVVYEVVR